MLQSQPVAHDQSRERSVPPSHDSVCSTDSVAPKKRGRNKKEDDPYAASMSTSLASVALNYERRTLYPPPTAALGAPLKPDDVYDLWGKLLAAKLRETDKKEAHDFMSEVDTLATRLRPKE